MRRATLERSAAGVIIEEISLDGNGRVAIMNPIWSAARPRKPPRPRPNTNCGHCNTAKGCDGENVYCHPNTVPNCGCRTAG